MLQNSGSAQPLPPEPVDGERTLAVEVYPDVQMAVFWTTECPILAETRRFAAVHYFAMLDRKSNGGTRPKAVFVDFKPMLCRLGKADINGWRNRQGSPERSGG